MTTNSEFSKREKSYWIKHLRRLAADNANYREELRLAHKEVVSLAGELEHYCQIFKEQNAQILTLLVVKGCLDSG